MEKLGPSAKSSQMLQRWIEEFLVDQGMEVPEQNLPELLSDRQKQKIRQERIDDDLRRMTAHTVSKLVSQLQNRQVELEEQTKRLLKTQTTLGKSQQRYIHLYEYAPVPYFTLDKNRRIIATNIAASQFLGKSSQRLVHHKFSKLLEQDSVSLFDNYCTNAYKTHEVQSCPVQLILDKNRSCFARLEISLLPDIEANTHNYHIAAIDISEYRKVEDILEERVEERTRDLIDAITSLNQEIAIRQGAEYALNQKAQQMQCLYEIINLGQNSAITLSELYKSAVRLIPAAFQYSEITGVRLTVNNVRYTNGVWNKKRYKLTSAIVVNGRKTGKIEVVYLERRPFLDKGPFFSEEMEFLDAVAYHLSTITEQKAAEAALVKSETRFRNVVDNIPCHVFIKDTNFKYVFCNEYFALHLNLNIEDILGKTDSEIFSEEKATKLRDIDSTILKTGQMSDIVEEQDVQGEQVKYRHIVKSAMRDDTGNISGIIGVSWDITEKREAEEAIRKERERYRDLCENANDIIQSVATDGRFLYVNRSWRQTLGYTEEELSGLRLWDIVHPDYLEGCRKSFQNIISGQLRGYVETVFIARDGSNIAVEGNVNCQYEHDEFIGTRGIFRDITRRRQAIEALRESEGTKRALLNATTESACLIDRKGKILSVNKTGALLAGLPASNIIGSEYFSIFSPANNQQRRHYIELALQTGKPLRFEDSDPPYIFDTKIYPVLNTEDEVEQLAIFSQDITDRKRTEEALIASERRYRLLAENMADVVWTTDTNLELTYISPAITQLAGYSQDELLHRCVELMLTESSAMKARDMLIASLKRFESFGGNILVSRSRNLELEVVRRNGTVIWTQTSIQLIFNSDGKPSGVLGVTRDISAQKEAEEALLRSESRLRKLVTEMPGIIWSTDRGLVINYIGGSVLANLGLRTDKLIGARVGKSRLAALSPSQFAMAHQFAISGESIAFDVTWQDRDMVCHIEPLRDLQGEITGVVGVGYDNTAQKQAETELRTLSRRLVETQENERNAISAELHDQIGQSLTVLKLTLEQASRLPDGNINKLLEQSQKLTSEIMSQIRNLSLSLRPTMLDNLGLLPALLWLCENFTRQTGININFKHRGLRKNFSHEVRTAVYRIVQESLTNIARHAQVKEAEVRVWANHNYMTVKIEDEGNGFNLHSLRNHPSSGVSGMRERVRALNGNIHIDSSPGRGTHILAEIPLDLAEEKKECRE